MLFKKNFINNEIDQCLKKENEFEAEIMKLNEAFGKVIEKNNCYRCSNFIKYKCNLKKVIPCVEQYSYWNQYIGHRLSVLRNTPAFSVHK